MNYTQYLIKQNLLNWLEFISETDNYSDIKQAASELVYIIRGNSIIPPKPSYNHLYINYKFKLISTITDNKNSILLYSYNGNEQTFIGIVEGNISGPDQRCCIVPNNSPTPSATPTATTTPLIEKTPSVTPSVSKTPTVTPSFSRTPTVTPSISKSERVCPSPTVSRTVTPSIIPTRTVTPSVTPSITPTKTVTPSVTSTNSVTPSISPTPTTTSTPNNTPSLTPSITVSRTVTPSITPTVTKTRDCIYSYTVQLGTLTLDSQTGLYKQTVRVTNTSVETWAGLDLIINIPPEVLLTTQVWTQHTIINNKNVIRYNNPIMPGETVQLGSRSVIGTVNNLPPGTNVFSENVIAYYSDLRNLNNYPPTYNVVNYCSVPPPSPSPTSTITPSVTPTKTVTPTVTSSPPESILWSNRTGYLTERISFSSRNVIVAKASPDVHPSVPLQANITSTFYGYPYLNCPNKNIDGPAGLSTWSAPVVFYFDSVINTPYLAIYSLGGTLAGASRGIGLMTSVPYELVCSSVISPGTSLVVVDSYRFYGLEAYGIIRFPGNHTSISFQMYSGPAGGELYTNFIWGARQIGN